MKKNGKYCSKKGMNMKPLAILLAMVLLVGCAIGGTLAWLLDTSDTVTNTFTDSDINITLTETTGENYQMIPGYTVAKDPVVTVQAGSEDCWVFVKVEETGVSYTTEDGNTHTYAFADFIDYKIDPNNWEQLKDDKGKPVSGVYVGTVPCKDITADRGIKVLENQQVLVKTTVTKEMMDIVQTNSKPILKFTAYASQLMKNNTEEFKPYEAWLNLNPSTT